MTCPLLPHLVAKSCKTDCANKITIPVIRSSSSAVFFFFVPGPYIYIYIYIYIYRERERERERETYIRSSNSWQGIGELPRFSEDYATIGLDEKDIGAKNRG